MSGRCPICGLPAERLENPGDCRVVAQRCARCVRFHEGRMECTELVNWVAEIRADAIRRDRGVA